MLLAGVTVAQIGNTGYANSVKFMSMIYLSKINGQMSVFLLEECSTKHSIKGDIQWGSTNSHFPLNTQNRYLLSYSPGGYHYHSLGSVRGIQQVITLWPPHTPLLDTLAFFASQIWIVSA